jgi:DNA-binding MarR family transcriptional regulator
MSSMSEPDDVALGATHAVRDSCLCLHVHRAARTLARRFDEAFRPLGLTSGQFSVLNALNRPDAPNMKQVAPLLSMDRTTLTAALKPLLRQGLVETAEMAGDEDRRFRRLTLTAEGHRTLAEAIMLWRTVHAEVEACLPSSDIDRLRDNLRAITT